AYSHADYQFEAGVVLGQAEVSNVDVDVIGIGGRMHFDQVDTSKGPLAEASFLDHASFVDVAYYNSETDIRGAEDQDQFNIGGRFVAPSGLIFEGEFIDSDIDDDSSIEVGIGSYLSDNTDVVVSYFTADDRDVDILTAAVHSLQDLQHGAAYSVDVGLSVIDSKINDGYAVNLGGAYFFTPRLAIGVDVELLDLDITDTNIITLGGSFFPEENIELSAAYFDQGGDLDSNGFELSAGLRF
ncbi:MAG: putative porin, partial [Spongiibacteraceae bacterium]